MRTTAALLLVTAFPAAQACDCVSPVTEFEKAERIVVAQVVALELPSLNSSLPGSPARSDEVVGRFVVREVLRGGAHRADARAPLSFRVQSRGMCTVRSPVLGEFLVVPLPEGADSIDITYCTALLTFGTRWQGWDEATVAVRDLFGPDAQRADLSDIVYRHVRWPMDPPPPPPAPLRPACLEP